ncbi:hypothetical protein BH20CHL4_BH20CHL4_02060 [soil metagenome]
MRDDRQRNGLSEEERRRVLGCGFSAAVVAAPFISLLYSQQVGLTVLAVALGCTVFFAVDAYGQAAGSERRRLLILTLINTAFLAAIVIVLIWLLLR